MMHDKALKLGLTLTMLVCTTSLSVESKDGAASQSTVPIKPADPILELQNQDTAFSLWKRRGVDAVRTTNREFIPCYGFVE
jgi:hypothetical protein